MENKENTKITAMENTNEVGNKFFSEICSDRFKHDGLRDTPRTQQAAGRNSHLRVRKLQKLYIYL